MYIMRINQYDDSVHMVWHDDPRVQFDMGIMIWKVIPCGLNNPPRSVQPHFAVNDLSEKRDSVLSANGDEICPILTVIKPTEAHRTAVVRRYAGVFHEF